MKRLTVERYWLVLVLLGVCTIGVCFVALTLGLKHIGWATVVSVLQAHCGGGAGPAGTPDMADTIIWQIRLPRVLMAFTVGMALSVAGVVFQSLLRNPLAEPHLIGVSSGAALGTVIASICFAGFSISPMLGLPLASFTGAIISISVIYGLSYRKGVLSVYTLLLLGVIMNSFFISVIIFIQTLMTPDELANIFCWLLGSIAFADATVATIAGGVVVGAVAFFITQARALDLLSLGEDRARSLGLPVERTKAFLYIIAALMVGVVVAISGLVGFVGLVVPHITRMLVGPDHRISVPASALIGGMLLVVADTLARTVLAPQEVPVGVITAFLGAPFFIILLKRKEARSIF